MKSFKEGNQSRQHLLSEYDKIFLVSLLGTLGLGSIFTIMYQLAGARYYNATFITAYHFLMFSVMLPNLIYLARDLFLILLKFSNKNSDIEIRDYGNFQ